MKFFVPSAQSPARRVQQLTKRLAVDLAIRALKPLDRLPGLSVLLFHRVHAAHDPYRPGDPTAEQFAAIVSTLVANFVVLPLDEGLDRLRCRALPRRAVAITFDDGYLDNLLVATPILISHHATATFFIATGYLEGGSMFNDRIIEAIGRTTLDSLPRLLDGLPVLPLTNERDRVQVAHLLVERVKYMPFDDRTAFVRKLEEVLGVQPPNGPMMTVDHLNELRRLGMTIGAHTVWHPILANVETTRARIEIGDSRDRLVDVLREPVTMFAYPNGVPERDYGPEHVRMVADAKFTAAFSTAPTTVRRTASWYELPRFTPWDRDGGPFAVRLLTRRLAN